MIKETELAFETEIHEETPTELWRVRSRRNFIKGQMTPTSWVTQSSTKVVCTTNWFATEDRARQHVEWINDGRGEVISIAKYILCPGSSRCPGLSQ